MQITPSGQLGMKSKKSPQQQDFGEQAKILLPSLLLPARDSSQRQF